MADELLEQLRSIIEGQIDFEGQKLVDSLSTTVLTFVGILSFSVGFILEDITRTIYIGLGGSALVFLLTVPPWPIYKRHPLTWLPVRVSEKEVDDAGLGNIVKT